MKDSEGNDIKPGDYVSSIFINLVGLVLSTSEEDGRATVQWQNNKQSQYRSRYLTKLEPEELI